MHDVINFHLQLLCIAYHVITGLEQVISMCCMVSEIMQASHFPYAVFSTNHTMVTWLLTLKAALLYSLAGNRLFAGYCAFGIVVAAQRSHCCYAVGTQDI